jgi:hypothetical protein
MLIFAGFCVLYDTYQMIVTIRQGAKPGELFSKCYFFRQVCDILNGDGVNTKIFNWLLDRHQSIGLFFVSIQQYSVALFVQLGFATTNTVLSSIDNSLLTETYQVTSFTLSLISAILGTLITFVFFCLFGKWRNDIVIFGNAKYSCVLMLLTAADIGLACASVYLAFQAVTSNAQYVFPAFKLGMTGYNIYCLWDKRPSKEGKDMLYFGACDSTVCVGNVPPKSGQSEA